MKTEYGKPIKSKQDTSSDIPDHIIESLARCILPSIQAYFESEEGQREFAAWKAQQSEKGESI